MSKVYTIEIHEYCKAKVVCEAESLQEALAKVECEYWENPNAYCVEPYDTFFKCVDAEDAKTYYGDKGEASE